jgi:hypothetical protein
VGRCRRYVSETVDRYCDRSALPCLLAQRDPSCDLEVCPARQTADAHYLGNAIRLGWAFAAVPVPFLMSQLQKVAFLPFGPSLLRMPGLIVSECVLSDPLLPVDPAQRATPCCHNITSLPSARCCVRRSFNFGHAQINE